MGFFSDLVDLGCSAVSCVGEIAAAPFTTAVEHIGMAVEKAVDEPGKTAVKVAIATVGLGVPVVSAAMDIKAATKGVDDPGGFVKDLAVTAACGAASEAAAPVIADALGATGILGDCATGKAIDSLHGAPRKSASLAKLGGGAKSIGGGGQAAALERANNVGSSVGDTSLVYNKITEEKK